MKVSRIYQILTVFLLGFALGLFVAFRYIQKSVPEGQNITIGDVKIKGKGTHDLNINIDQEATETVQEGKIPASDPGKKKRRRRN